MKILFVVPYAPSLIRVRPFNLIRGLARRGHEVTLATLWTDPKEKEALRPLRDEGVSIVMQRMTTWRSAWNCLRTLPSKVPLQSVFSWHPVLATQIDHLLSGSENQPYDIVHVEHLRGARYGVFIQARACERAAGVPIVWDSVDCISHLFRQASEKSPRFISRWMSGFEQGRTMDLEGLLRRRFAKTLVTSEADRKALMEIPPQMDPSEEKIAILPNGVDLDYFAPDRSRDREPATVILSGKMSYHANVAMVAYFVENVLPRLIRLQPDLSLWIVGKGASGRIRQLDSHPHITVTGEVPSMLPYLQRATVACAPLTYGAGIQNKVLEAMACATPVVASPLAARSLKAEPGIELEVAESPDQYSRAIADLLAQPAKQRAMGRAGRRYVEEHHDWSQIAADLEEIYIGVNGYE